MRDYTLKLLANVPRSMSVAGNFIHYVSGQNPVTFEVNETNDSYKMTRKSGAELSIKEFGKISIVSKTDQEIVISIGHGSSSYSGEVNLENLNISQETANSFVPLSDVSIAANSSAIIASSKASRKELRVSIPDDVDLPLRVGDSSVTATKGGLLYAGTVEYISNSAAIYAFNPDPSNAVTVSLVSLEVN